MNLNIIENNDKIIIQDAADFEPRHIFECGQAFRWHIEEDSSYTAVFKENIININKIDSDVVFTNTNMHDFKNIWYDYFDLGRDYGEIKRELSKDPVLKEAIKFGEGIRILNQDLFETIISFIISANNYIPRIKRSVELIAMKYGERIHEGNGKRQHYSFPSPDKLASANENDLEHNCKVGYRAKYIVKTSEMISNREIDLDKLPNLAADDAKELLMKLPGVGPKVSNCILLFSLRKNEAFPVDVWIKRVMEHFYFKEGASIKEISEYAENEFGSLGGFAQQYLFYYARALGIGRKKE